ncbi:XdhC family protein [uncultured Erythrobacter sp.]|uniref:XdhC family protein n=1 Tax=uncultured Erythrobacter sp. TaxID=263913 RepID=UPI00261037F4|nr:XdhC family protein [uncultured Erythrobacter sp.]
MDLPKTCQFLNEAQSRGLRMVLVTVCGVEGSSMRNPGTIMGVAEDGSFAGSLSGGCIENAVVAEAIDVLTNGAPRVVRFGAGSSYLDIRLPCGGGLDLSFHVIEDTSFVQSCLASIEARTPFSIETGPGGPRHVPNWHQAVFDPEGGEAIFGHYPGPDLQIIGHGGGVEALATMAAAFGCTARILTPDERLIQQLRPRGFAAHLLERTNQTDLLQSDPWTATVFLFHDHDWEIDLMEQALTMPHFYLGAMGGRRAYAFRNEALSKRGVSQDQLDTIRAPIGLFHSSRDPHTLALSTLGEVIRSYEETSWAPDV